MNTLCLTRPLGKTLGLTLVFLILFLGIGETVTRTQFFRSRIVANNRGLRHNQFEVQLGRIETIYAKEGSIDCIMLGNSMVLLGFDPAAFARGYESQTGMSLQCFNFGVDGMPAASAAIVASILVQDFGPRLLIYGTDARDYVIRRDVEASSVLLDTPWIKYRTGDFSILGWLYEHFYLFRYWETIGNLVILQKQYLYMSDDYTTTGYDLGFLGEEKIKLDVSFPPELQTYSGQVQGYFELLSNYEMLKENLVGFEQIVSHNSKTTQLLILEMPVPETYYHFFGEGQPGYQLFLDQIENISERNEFPFWRTAPQQLFSPEAWVDYSHLNAKGAEIFSMWFGQRLGEAILQGSLENLNPGTMMSH
jgi:hypothetical protein